jgi:hypothetical protein
MIQRIRHAINETNYRPARQTGGRCWPRTLDELDAPK